MCSVDFMACDERGEAFRVRYHDESEGGLDKRLDDWTFGAAGAAFCSNDGRWGIYNTAHGNHPHITTTSCALLLICFMLLPSRRLMLARSDVPSSTPSLREARACESSSSGFQSHPAINEYTNAFRTITTTMALPQSAYKDREFLAVIGDEVLYPHKYVASDCANKRTQDSVTGILLAGVGVCASQQHLYATDRDADHKR